MNIMHPSRVDSIVDLLYGVLIFVAVALMMFVENNVGVAFGIGVLVSYMIHVGWKMARYDPDWMTTEITESVEETMAYEVRESVADQVKEQTEEVTASVEETMAEEVTESVTDEVQETVAEEVQAQTEEVSETVTEEVKEVKEQVEEVSERVEETDESSDSE